VSLGWPSYAGVTRHLGQKIQVRGEKERTTPHPCRRQGGFASRVAGPYYDNFISRTAGFLQINPLNISILHSPQPRNVP